MDIARALTGRAGARVRASWAEVPRRWSLPGVFAVLGGLGVSIGACLPWMSLYAGLVPLRGVIGLNGRLLLAAGVLGVALGVVLARDNPRSNRVVFRRLSAALGIAVTGAAIWLLIGVWQLSQERGSSAMLVPRAGPGLFVVALAGGLLVLAACVPAGFPQKLTPTLIPPV